MYAAGATLPHTYSLDVAPPSPLVEAGVPQSDVVLGYRSPFVRQFTGFGVVLENESEAKPLEGVNSN